MRKPDKPKVIKFSKKKLTDELMQETRALGLHQGSSEIMVARVVLAVENWANSRTMITQIDLNKAIAKEVKKYNKDLAYVYQNRGKII